MKKTTVLSALLGALLMARAAHAALAATPEEFLEAAGPQGPLKATLRAADQAGPNRPVVLIIPGSGPTDRDGNNPLGVKAAPYRLLAEALAAQGVSTVRIDKRGMFASAGAIPDANQVTIADYAADAQAWTRVIQRKTGAPCVWLLGHSEGGLVALAAAQRPEGLCGLILVAAGGRPLGEVLRDQFRANPANAPILKDAESAIDRLTQGERVDVSALHPALQRIFAPAVQGLLISSFGLDPTKLLGAYSGPVLILQGERDLQVSVDDARRLSQADSKAKLMLLPGVNHVLKAVAGDTPGANFATYADPSLPLAPGIAEAIAGFVRGAQKP